MQDRNLSVRVLDGMIKKPDFHVSIDDMNKAIRLEASSGYKAAATGRVPTPGHLWPRS